MGNKRTVLIVYTRFEPILVFQPKNYHYTTLTKPNTLVQENDLQTEQSIHSNYFCAFIVMYTNLHFITSSNDLYLEENILKTGFLM